MSKAAIDPIRSATRATSRSPSCSTATRSKLINEDKGKARASTPSPGRCSATSARPPPKDVKERFALLGGECRGAALGAEAGKPHGANAQPAADLFRSMLGADLSTMEPAFRAWLATL